MDSPRQGAIHVEDPMSSCQSGHLSLRSQERKRCRSAATRDGLREGHRGALAPQIRGQMIARFERFTDRPTQRSGLIGLAKVIKHLGGSQHQRTGVGLALTRDIRRRAVHSFEDSLALANVGPRCHAQPTDQTRTQIGQDIAEQVGGHDDIELLGLHDQLHTGVIDDQLVGLDLRILSGHPPCCLKKQPGGLFDDIGLVHDGDLTAPGALRHVIRIARNAFAALTGNTDITVGFFTVVGQRLPFTAIGPFGILAHHDQVQIAIAGLRIGKANGWAHIGIKIEVTTQRHIDGREATANRRHQWTLERHA
ncbi:ABC-type sugar transport systems, ATPase [Zymobacter palmae]|uniref:ABC-type sugar transport systems, ATPase n=1 Tax=Zymobacter palmae TaxID=33074 RepID=A0A348HIF9_9GAMM|nr:ABC-type sugar transport systems, ATPase [Zymobacter palmae]